MPTRTRTPSPRLYLALALSLMVCLLTGGCTASARSYTFEHKYSVVDRQFQRTMDNLLGPPLIPGNSTTTLLNGDQIFPAMLNAIREARTSITFETYVYWRGLMGAVFTDALAERARAGVKVHILIDAVGRNRIDHGYEDMMEAAGAEVVL